MQSEQYWNERQFRRLIKSEQIGRKTTAQVVDIYEEALRNVNNAINNIYVNYSKKTGLSVDELSLVINGSDRAKFFQSVQKNMKKLGMNIDVVYQEGYLYRLSRLDALKKQIYWEVSAIKPQEERVTKKAYKKIIEENGNEAKSDVKKRLKIGGSFERIDQSVIEQMLNEKWQGSNYSERVWDNVDQLAKELPKLVGGQLLMGQPQEKTSQLISRRFDVAKWKATRLVRTESNYFQNQSELVSYKENGVNYYQFDAIMDSRTSNICREHDGKVYKVSEAKVGTNYPPMLPNCRSDTLLVFDEDLRTPPSSIVDLENRWGKKEKLTDIGKMTINSKLKQGRDKQYNAEAEWIGQLYPKMNPKLQKEAYLHLDEIIFQIDDAGQKQQVELLKKYIDPPKNFVENRKLDIWKSSSDKSLLKVVEDKQAQVLSNAGINVIKSNLKGQANGIFNGSAIKVDKKLSNKFVPYTVHHEIGHAIDYFGLDSEAVKKTWEGVKSLKLSNTQDFKKLLFESVDQGISTVRDNVLNEDGFAILSRRNVRHLLQKIDEDGFYLSTEELEGFKQGKRANVKKKAEDKDFFTWVSGYSKNGFEEQYSTWEMFAEGYSQYKNFSDEMKRDQPKVWAYFNDTENKLFSINKVK